MDVSLAVIGAGVVGVSVAVEFAKAFPGRNVLVLERNAGIFSEASRYNSGVIHSGVHHKPDLLKSRLARDGAPRMLRFCEEEGVPFRKTGMLIAVSREDFLGLGQELKSLWLLYRNTRRQKIPLTFLWSRGMKALEPALKASFGIFLPDVWVVNQSILGEKLGAFAERSGVQFAFDDEVKRIARVKDVYRIETARGAHTAGIVVNASGVNADRVAALAGFRGYTIYPYRGEYYEVIGSKRNLIRSMLVYPALPPGHPVKGIHLTKTADNRLLIGPNVSRWQKRRDDFRIKSPSYEFLREARKFLVPGLEAEDLRWAYSGLRPKVNLNTNEDDFLIRCDAVHPSFINLIGIESPGLTAAFAIAAYVVTMLRATNNSKNM